MAYLEEDDGEDFEGEVEECVDEAGVESDGGDHGFREQHAQRAS